MDVVGYPHKRAAYYYVTINAPMTCLTLEETLKSLMVGRKTTIENISAKISSGRIFLP